MAVFQAEHIDFFQRKQYPIGIKMPVVHFHHHHELYYLVSGRISYLIGNEVFLLEPGDFAFIPKGICHQTDSSNYKDVERILIVFDDFLAGQNYLRYIKEMTENKHIRIQPDRLGRVQDLLLKIEEECKNRSDDYREMQKLYLRELLILISRYRQTRPKPTVPISDTSKIILNAAKFISEAYAEKLTLDVFAKKYSISAGYFSKLFKKVTGIGLNDYIMLSRITAAQKMLLEGESCITDIAVSCGFNDSSYFSKSFKKIFGVTPKNYRVQNLDK